MPDFDIFSLLECRKCKTGSHGVRKNDSYKRKNYAQLKLQNHGRHSMLAFLSSLPTVLRIVDN